AYSTPRRAPRQSTFSAFRSRRDLHSFPTRRSSDLIMVRRGLRVANGRVAASAAAALAGAGVLAGCWSAQAGEAGRAAPPARAARSEEHTSELQSPYDLVCRLLLEKKNMSPGNAVAT